MADRDRTQSSMTGGDSAGDTSGGDLARDISGRDITGKDIVRDISGRDISGRDLARDISGRDIAVDISARNLAPPKDRTQSNFSSLRGMPRSQARDRVDSELGPSHILISLQDELEQLRTDPPDRVSSISGGAGLLDKGSYLEALRAVETLQAASGQDSLMQQADRVEELVLDLVEETGRDRTESFTQAPLEVPTLRRGFTNASSGSGNVPTLLRGGTGLSTGSGGRARNHSKDSKDSPVREPSGEHSVEGLNGHRSRTGTEGSDANADGAANGGGLGGSFNQIEEGNEPPPDDDSQKDLGADIDNLIEIVTENPGAGKRTLRKSGRSMLFGPKEMDAPDVTWQEGLLEFAELLVREVMMMGLFIPHMVLFWSGFIEDDRLKGASVLEAATVPLPAYVAGRVAVVLLYAIVDFIALCVYFPGSLKIGLAAFRGWPATALFFIGAFYLMPTLEPWIWNAFPQDNAEDVWTAWATAPKAVRVTIWLLLAAISRASVEIFVMVVVNGLTLRHYEGRAKSAAVVYNAINALFAVAEAADKAKKKVDSRAYTTRKAAMQKATEQAQERLVEAHSEHAIAFRKAMSSRLGRLEYAMQVISKPLRLGIGVQNLLSLDEARQRALTVYMSLLKAQTYLHGFEEDGLVREQVLEWADGKIDGPSGALFDMEIVKAEDFVAVVERAYKEHKFITASFNSFDMMNSIIARFFVSIWGFLSLLTYALVMGLSFQEWLIPVLTLLFYVCWVLSRLVGEVVQGALFVLWTRPYDIGDWIKISEPGERPNGAELAPVKITLLNTLFVNAYGEQVLLENQMLHTKSINNLTRSGAYSFPIQIQVPSRTCPSKLTELVDSLREYVKDMPEDWADASFGFNEINYKDGYLVLELWATAKPKFVEFSAVAACKSRLFLFVHAYMKATGIEYECPPQPVATTTATMRM